MVQTIRIMHDSVLNHSPVRYQSYQQQQQEYLYINFYLKGEPKEKRCYLSYRACKEEEEHISKLIRCKENTSIFIEGL